MLLDVKSYLKMRTRAVGYRPRGGGHYVRMYVMVGDNHLNRRCVFSPQSADSLILSCERITATGRRKIPKTSTKDSINCGEEFSCEKQKKKEKEKKN